MDMYAVMHQLLDRVASLEARAVVTETHLEALLKPKVTVMWDPEPLSDDPPEPGAEPESEPEAPAPKKRGRPRKVVEP